TLFATGDSSFSGELRALFPRASWPPTESAELAHARWALHEISRSPVPYDAVQLNSAEGLRIARDLQLPVVYTIHHRRDARLSRMYAAHPEVQYVAISARQLELEIPLRKAAVVHHGVNPDLYPVTPSTADHLVHVGRFAPEKGTHHAVDAALRA